MDALKKWIVGVVKEGVRREFKANAIHDNMSVEVMQDVEPLAIQVQVRTPSGPRFFLVRVQEKY